MNWKEFGRSGFGLIKVLFQHLLGGTEENHKNLQSALLVPWLRSDSSTY
jgi:hypothetical protein